MKTLPLDYAFYFENKDGNLLGLYLSLVDDFTIAGEDEFVTRIVEVISDRFTVSKVDKDEFRFTGLDIKTGNVKIEVCNIFRIDRILSFTYKYQINTKTNSV